MSSRAQKKPSARDRAAQIRAEQLHTEQRRRLALAGGGIALVLIVVAAMVVARLDAVGAAHATAATGKASAQVVSEIDSVPKSVLDDVGVGTTQGGPKRIDAPTLTAGGKPRVLYVGAEYCPYCAAERWPMAVALARFGTFRGLGAVASASNDVYPNTPTLSFHGATYSSPYLSFTGVETTTNQRVGGGYEALDSLSAADAKTLETYDKAPYVSGQGGAIPFIDIGGTYVSDGASYSPQLLAGKTQAQVAAALGDPASPIARAVDGAANKFTAAICEVTKDQPGKVCTSPGVTKAAASLGRG